MRANASISILPVLWAAVRGEGWIAEKYPLLFARAYGKIITRETRK